jgi:arsenate reductase
MQKLHNILILCTGNSARSIIGEALFNTMGAGRVKAFSAGSHPTGRMNPFAIDVVRGLGYPVENLRSKSWDEFAVPGAPELDFVITVCDKAAGEVCPFWPGQPITAHWGFPDPAAVEGTDDEKRVAFAQTLRQMRRRVELFLSLPIDALDSLAIEKKVREIGQQPLQ